MTIFLIFCLCFSCLKNICPLFQISNVTMLASIMMEKSVTKCHYRKTITGISQERLYFFSNKYSLLKLSYIWLYLSLQKIFSVISYGLDGQQKNLGYFINKASKDLQLSIQPQLAGFPTINSSIWNPLQLCTSSWLSSSHNADVMCRSMSHFGGGMR